MMDANPLDQFAEVVGLLHRIDDAGAKNFRAHTGLEVSAGHDRAHAWFDLLHPQKNVASAEPRQTEIAHD